MDVRSHNAIAADPKRIGARMRDLRRARGMTGKAVAELMGIARPNYLRSERGLHQQQLFILERFATALDIRFEELFSATPEPSPYEPGDTCFEGAYDQEGS